jgi:ribonuclease HI
MNKIAKLYCDGGLIGSNPSPLGGTFAWIGLDSKGEEIASGKGIILPSDIGMESVSNNVSELYAAMDALEYVGEGWKGIIYTDSKITLHRIEHSKSFKGIPNFMRLKILDLRRCRKYRVVLLKGHPSQEDLKRGKTLDGKPVSIWNKKCDEMCNELAREFMNGKRE